MFEFLRSLFDPLFDLLGAILLTFHGWGVAWWLCIIMLTVVVRTLLFPLTFRQVKNMARMQELKPDLDEIRARHEDDPKKQQEEQMKLYGERGINPLSGCFPLLVQLPIFIVLYQTIKQFEALKSFRTGGLFWFQDLTVADPLYILPVLYVLTMMASQEITIRRTNPQQKQLMRALPLVFGGFLAFSGFPAGLFVYWVASNVITFGQNCLIYRNNPVSAIPDPVSAGNNSPSAEREAGEDASETPGRLAKPESQRSPVSKTPGKKRSKKKVRKKR